MALMERLRHQIIRGICEINEKMCPAFDAQMDLNFYETQKVFGTNYFVRLVFWFISMSSSIFTLIFVSTYSMTIENVVYHVKIYNQPWTNIAQIDCVQGPKQLTDEVFYFC